MLSSLLFFMALVQVAYGGAGVGWGYDHHDGPHTWKGKCTNTFGRQSPIDIRASDVDYTPLHRLQFLHYDHPGQVKIKNEGKTILVTGFDTWGPNQPLIQGGGLRHRYKLVQFHLHWGQHDSEGSEHTMGSLHYPAELHLVHIREGLSITEAKSRPDGLAVVGVFLARTHKHHGGHNLHELATSFSLIEQYENSTDIRSFRTRNLLPDDTEAFYRYDGSLTTPECDEAVVWTILAEPIAIDHEQLKLLRAIKRSDGAVVHKNYRPTQPLNGRRILYRPNKFDHALLCSSAQAFTWTALILSIFFL